MKLFTKIRKKGQALVMVTLALFAMCGLLGLAVDLGWSFFVKRAAQAVADAAAVAAVEDGLQRLGASVNFVCGTALTCQSTPVDCPTTIPSPPGNNLQVGCAYGFRNGFTVGGNGGRQNITIQADVPAASCADVPPPNCIPTAPGVEARYWVTVRVTERIPQLFSAIFGNTETLVAARATAGIVNSIVIGSLILINRQNEEMNAQGGQWIRGINLRGGGGVDVSVPGGILMASNCREGVGPCTGNAGHLSGNTDVASPFTYVRTGGVACASNIPGCAQVGTSTWIAPYEPRTDASYFLDPMRGKGQPPLTTQALPGRPILGGTIQGGTAQNPTLLEPGNYYATTVDNKTGATVATGNKVQLANGHFQFIPCGGCSPGTGFADFVFWGGLSTGGGNTTVTFNPGRYVFAGQNTGDGGSLFFLSNGTTLNDFSVAGQQNTDPGALMVFTDANYPGLDVQLGQQDMQLVNAIKGQLQFGQSGFTMGQNAASSISLHGLNDQHPLIQGTPLAEFSPVLLWQDQRNSRVTYQPDGNIDTSCGSMDNPCYNAPPQSLSRAMNIQATPNSSLFGAVYQPRGAWLNMQGGGAQSGSLQIITGAVNIQGSGNMTLQGIPNPVTRRVAALVE